MRVTAFSSRSSASPLSSKRRARPLAVVVVVAALLAGVVQQPALAAPGSAAPKTPHGSAVEGMAGRSTRGAAGDVVVNGWGDANGYHVELGRGGSGYVWREVALLRPAGLDEPSWTGYQCLSGDGRYAAVAIEPTSAVNIQAARDRGAFAYSVQLSTGRVLPLASGVALKYFTPGCGVGDSAVFTLNLGSNEAQTELLNTDLATGKITETVTLPGQVTSTVPTGRGLVGVAGSSLVRIVPGSGTTGHTRALAHTGGDAYDLRPAADGGIDLPDCRTRRHHGHRRPRTRGPTREAGLGTTDPAGPVPRPPRPRRAHRRRHHQHHGRRRGRRPGRRRPAPRARRRGRFA